MARIRKFGNGGGAILCSNCRKIVKQGWASEDDQNPDPSLIKRADWDSNDPIYCDK